LKDPPTERLVEFFESKGLEPLKDEDRREEWYADWIEYQKTHALYASVLSPEEYSARGTQFDLLRYARFLETFAYCSPAHGYSLQVTFLGLFCILMGSNADLKREAVAALEQGSLMAFGVSEQEHGSDLLANEFTIRAVESGGYIANGRKYYIGNTDVASIISVLGRKIEGTRREHSNRAPFMLIAVRPQQNPNFKSLGKIRTLGVRAANVGSFEVLDQAVSPSDVIAEGRTAWDSIFGTITLGKFFLGFGSIGMCERSLEEASAHLKRRILYGKPAIEMPHLRALAAQAYIRLLAMKLYAFRAIDYVHAGSAADRRYLLFCAVQKAKVSTEGVKVMALLQECMGAKGFESDTYFEMALRDVQLIPGLEGSMHINLGLALQFIRRYFDRPDSGLAEPASITGGETSSRENPYLFRARTGSPHAVSFPDYREAYRAIETHPNVAMFAVQIDCFNQLSLLAGEANAATDSQTAMAIGHCFATIVYGQLVAENIRKLNLPLSIVNRIFSVLVTDLTQLALQFAAIPNVDAAQRQVAMQMVKVPENNAIDWEFQL
jgi:acyl-CoA dehydrogenase